MKPWVNRGHKNYELRRSGTNNASIEVLVLCLLYCSIILSSGYPAFIYLFFAPLGIISLRLLGVSFKHIGIKTRDFWWIISLKYYTSQVDTACKSKLVNTRYRNGYSDVRQATAVIKSYPANALYGVGYVDTRQTATESKNLFSNTRY